MAIEFLNAEITLDAPESKRAEIVRKLKLLLSTPEGTAALDREFGLDWGKFLDMPFELARGRYMIEVREKVKKYVPEVEIVKFVFSAACDGKIIPKVVVKIV